MLPVISNRLLVGSLDRRRKVTAIQWCPGGARRTTLTQPFGDDVNSLLGLVTACGEANADQRHEVLDAVDLTVIDQAGAMPVTEMRRPFLVFAERHQTAIPDADIIEGKIKAGIARLHLVDEGLEFVILHPDRGRVLFPDHMPGADQRVVPPRRNEQMAVAATNDGVRIVRLPLRRKRDVVLEQSPVHDETRIPRIGGSAAGR